MATYLRTVPPIANPDLPAPKSPDAIAAHAPGASGHPLGEQIYAEACASCHGWTGKSPISGLATIAGARTVNDPSGVNVAQVILFGGGRKPGEAGMAMPAFGDAYSDAEIAAAANLCHGAVRRRGLAPDGGECRFAPAHPVTGELAIRSGLTRRVKTKIGGDASFFSVLLRLVAG